MKNVIIKSHWFTESDLRMDASFHLSDAVNNKRIIEKLCPYPVTTLKKESIELYKGNIHKRVYVSSPEHGFTFYAASDLFKANLVSGKFVSKLYSPYIEELSLKRDWILITRSGTLGKVAYVTSDYEGTIGTDDLVRIKPSEDKIKKGLLYAYLSTTFGYALITQSGYGGVVKHIEPHHLESLKIPIFPDTLQTKVDQLIMSSIDLRVEANKLLNESIKIIEDGLNATIDSNVYIGKTSIKKLLKNHQNRLDSPSYLFSGVTEIEKLKQQGIKFQSLKSLGFVVTRPGIFKRVKVKSTDGFPYIKGSELGRHNPFSSCEFLSKTKTPFLNQLKLKDGQILFTCAGTVGDVKLISKEFEEKEAIGSQDIIRIEDHNASCSNAFLFAYLKTNVIKSFVQSMKYGSVIERVEPFHVETIPVWVPDEEVYQKIVDNIKLYKSLLYTSVKNEERAILELEKEMESWQK